MAWSHQFIDPTGRVKPCCRFSELYRPKEHSLDKTSVDEVFYGPWMNEVRRKMAAGERVDGCVRCYEEQDAGKRSLRQRYNDQECFQQLVDLEKPKVGWIELAISNDCNLACRMCDSRYSWRWFEEEKKLFGKTFNSQEKTKIDIDRLDPYLSSIQHIKFTGGEPLMTPDHYRLIKKLVASGRAKDISLNYSTNCTIRPNDELIGLWKQFSYIEFAMSFDAARKGEAEYIRWPAKYEKIEETTQFFLKLHKSFDARVGLRSTVSILNIDVISDTVEWWLQQCAAHYVTGDPGQLTINPTHLTYPQILSLQVLPQRLKDQVGEKLVAAIAKNPHRRVRGTYSYLLNYMMAADLSHLLPDLQRYLRGTDQSRNQNFESTYPYFAGLFDGIPENVQQSVQARTAIEPAQISVVEL